MLDRKISVAIVGAGEIGTKAHIPAYLRSEHVKLVSLVDADEKKLQKAAKKFGIKNCYSSIDDLLKKQSIDAISVCTPPTTHTQIVLKAIDNGVHVLCEKPFATNTDDGKVMLEAAREKQTVLAVGFNLRFCPNYEYTARQIRNGRVGHTHLVEFNLQSPNPLMNWSKSPWFFSKEAGGGVLLDKGPHAFDMINYVLNDFPFSVTAVSSTFFQSPVEDSCICILEYPDNKLAVATLSWLSSRVIELLSVHGTAQNLFVSRDIYLEANANGLVEVDLFRKAANMLVNLKFHNLPIFKLNNVDTFQLEINSFIDQIRAGRPDYSSALSGANVVTTCNAAKLSLETGKKVSFTPIKGPKCLSE